MEPAPYSPCRAGGDTGSLIVNAERCAVALLFAGSDHGGANGQGLTYANPIHTVLDALKIEFPLRTRYGDGGNRGQGK